MTANPPAGPDRWILISDVDNTVLGDDDATRRFAEFVEARRGTLWVALNSGRFVDSVLESVQQSPLPEPDLIIGGVGTDILPIRESMSMNPASSAELTGWSSSLGPADWGDQIRKIVHQIDGIQPQPAYNQSSHKASFYAYNAPQEFIDNVQSALTDAGFKVSVVYSSDRDLDVLPAGIDKAAACHHVAKTLGLPADRVMISGDSGNDRAMLTAGFRSIIVGNALPELDDLQGENIYRARQNYADGVIEGIEHWMGIASG